MSSSATSMSAAGQSRSGRCSPHNDHEHDQSNARGVPGGPRESQPTRLEQAALPRGEGRHRRQVIGLEGVAEAK